MSRRPEWIFFQRGHVSDQEAHDNIVNHQRNANQNYKETYLTSANWVLSKLQLTIVGKDVEKREHFVVVVGNVNWCSRYGKQYGSSSKN